MSRHQTRRAVRLADWAITFAVGNVEHFSQLLEMYAREVSAAGLLLAVSDAIALSDEQRQALAELRAHLPTAAEITQLRAVLGARHQELDDLRKEYKLVKVLTG